MAKGIFKASEEKQRDGNPGRHPIKGDFGTGRLGNAPKELDDKEKEYWKLIKDTAYWLKGSDKTIVKMLCQCLYDLDLARAELREVLLLSDDEEKKVDARVRELNKLLKDSHERAYQIMGVIGLSPRARNQTAKVEPVKDAVITDLLNG